MQTRAEIRAERKGRAKRPKAPTGGKALQRLFFYLGGRDPALNDEVIATVAPAALARPAFGLTARALRAMPATAATARRVARAVPTARPMTAAIVKAAGALAPRGAKPAPRARRRAAPAPPIPHPGGWVPIGPSNIPNGQTYGSNRVDVIGRVSCLAVDARKPAHLLLGSAGGGIWESADAGVTWSPRTDHLPSLAIGAIAFDPRNPKRVYAGSGEGNFYANLGAGVYRSLDGGTTWKVLASAPFIGVGFYDLVVDPRRRTILYAATTSGLYRSTNGGVSWSLRRAGRCWGISVHPKGGTVELLATFVDGLFTSSNAGTSFTPVALPGVPGGAWTRLAVDRVLVAPDVAYVLGAAGSQAYLWRRTGTTWTAVTPLPGMNINQAWYDWYVAAPPDDPQRVYLGAIDTMRGTLTGTAWAWQNVTSNGGQSIHPDQHCLAFVPGSPRTIYAGNDGGLYRSRARGIGWTALNKGLGITEIEYLGSDPQTWKWLMAGTQDNGTIRYTGSLSWDHIADGDGGDCGVNQANPMVVYHSYYGVSLDRSANKGNTWTSLAPPGGGGSLFYPPVEVFGSTVAIGAAALVVTRTGAGPWTTVPLGLAAGEYPSAMRDIDANTILIGTTAGRMLRLAWSGATWSKTALTSPVAKYLSCIAVDPSNPQRIWVTSSQIGAGGLVYRSDDGGSTWTDCTAGLPKIPMNSVVVDPANYRRVWVAADVGVYQTMNLGSGWASFANGLPNALAADLVFHKQDRMLICATRNRGAWVIHVP
jgi:photosystem II stability/assembly factor-like uncharacterized protein